MIVAKATFHTVEWGYVAGDLKLVIERFKEDRERKALRVHVNLEASSDLQAHFTLVMHTLADILRRIVKLALLKDENLMPLMGHKITRKTIGLTMADCAALHLIRDFGTITPFSSLIRIATDAMMRH